MIKCPIINILPTIPKIYYFLGKEINLNIIENLHKNVFYCFLNIPDTRLKV